MLKRKRCTNLRSIIPPPFSPCKYQVFLSFRGEDTCKNFTDHLYAALVQAGVHTFRDDDEIRRGENIGSELKNAIQRSKILIIVFSKDYASSRWCLDELVMIMEHRRTAGCMVLPVFYDVDPSEVRKQTGSFAKAFIEHERSFEKERQRVNGWRTALQEVADLAGMVLGDRHEARFVQSIVDNVSKKLDRRIFHVPFHLIGRDSLISYINSWLQDESHGAAIVILCGIGGVGKTAIAKDVYNHNFDKFEGRSFLANVRERSKESNGLVILQRQLLSDILNKTADEIYDVDEGIMKIKDAICCRRTLIVLDNVDTREQLNAIIGMQNWLCHGSKIIVTTRNKGSILVQDDWIKCEVKPLDNKESLELFSWHAFGQAHPVEDFVEHSKKIVRHCNGLPLALHVIGSSLSGKGTNVWESAIQEMEVIPNSEVQKVLKASYDSLDDEYQKNLFLDIACFFIGMDEDYVVRILDGVGVGIRATYRIDNLIDRSLLEIDKDKRLWMHQLIRDMGREIARQESSKCQRTWDHMEAFTILKETTQDTETVRGLALDMHTETCLPRVFVQRVQTSQTSLFPVFIMDAFRKMQNIKFLQLDYLKIDGNYEQFPKSLVWLCWHGFPLRSIPKHFCLEKLVVLDLSRSSLVDVWKGKMSFPQLKILDLRHSYDLIRTPDFSGLPVLEMLILEDCIHLVEFHESIGDLQSLLILNLRNCKSLVELPEEVSKLNSLEKLVLDGCSNLDGLYMEGWFRWMRQLQRAGIIPNTLDVTSLPFRLHFRSWFSTRRDFRFTFFSFSFSLVELNLDGTRILSLPESIKGLGTLKFLYLRKCKRLQTLPELPSDLQVIDVSCCYKLRGVPNLIHTVIHEDCDRLVQVQDLIKLELIEKFDLHMLQIMEMVSLQIQPLLFQVTLEDNIFMLLLEESEFLRFYKEDEWLIQNEFQELSFKISNVVNSEHHICSLNLFIRFFAKSEFDCTADVEIKNTTKGKSIVIFPNFLPTKSGIGELLILIQPKCWGEDVEFDVGDEVSVTVHTYDYEPGFEIKTIGVRILYEEEEKNHNIQAYNEVVIATAKAEIASQVFTYYYCDFRYNGGDDYFGGFLKKDRGKRRRTMID